MGRRTRSPNYPRIGLRDAIERIEKVYKRERTHTTTREAIAEGLGYTSLNGSSMGIISTLRQYGLLLEEPDGLRVSQTAVALVMLPDSDPERVAALREAALAPRLFSEFYESYRNSLPSDVSLRYALIKKGFSEKAANEAIRAYRDTMELVAEEAPEYTEEVVEDDPSEVETPMQPTEVPAGGSRAQVISGGGVAEPRASVAPATVLQFQISGNSSARIELMGDVTQEAIDRLAKILDVQKFVFPSESALQKPAIEQQPLERTVIEAPVEQPAIELPAPE